MKNMIYKCRDTVTVNLDKLYFGRAEGNFKHTLIIIKNPNESREYANGNIFSNCM